MSCRESRPDRGADKGATSFPGGQELARQRGLHQAARLAEIHLAGVLRPQRGDHLAHVLHAGGAGFGDGVRDRLLHLVVGHLLRQIRRDHRDLLALLRCKLGAAALFVELDRLLALLDHLLEDAEQIGVRQRRLAVAARLDVGVLDGRVDHAQRGQLALVLGLHGLLDRIVDVVAQHDRDPFNPLRLI